MAYSQSFAGFSSAPVQPAFPTHSPHTTFPPPTSTAVTLSNFHPTQNGKTSSSSSSSAAVAASLFNVNGKLEYSITAASPDNVTAASAFPPNLTVIKKEIMSSTASGASASSAALKAKKSREPKGAEPVSEEESSLVAMSLNGKCDYCDYECDKKDRIRRHVRTVHFREKPFHCELCPLQFGRKDKLKRHMETLHSNEKPYKCDFCSATFARKDKLTLHTRRCTLKNQIGETQPQQAQQQQQQQVQEQLNPLLRLM